MTDLTLKLLTNILNTARIGVPINGETYGCYVSSTRSGGYAARKDTQKTMTLAIGRNLPLEIWAVTDGMYCLYAGSKGFLVNRGTLEECLAKAEEVDS